MRRRIRGRRPSCGRSCNCGVLSDAIAGKSNRRTAAPTVNGLNTNFVIACKTCGSWLAGDSITSVQSEPRHVNHLKP
ncbi:hypothetical protein AN403_4482 [Pseudomonas fluorescens]|uniref:Uncharacterized protein n=1 Tax=Pseudomonas fluorescens TaxID=294 RepID=A0A0P8XJN2_PSEFL|nr:hypothetical protein AN403_4482 [Pseudomonas fluorescens]